MTDPYLIIPLLNDTVTTFELPMWHLSELIYVSPIRGDDYHALHRDANDVYLPIITPTTLCLYVRNPKLPYDVYARSLCAQLQFVLKTFAKEPIILSQAALMLEEQHGKRILSSIELNHSVMDIVRRREFSFMEGTTPGDLAQWFTVVAKVSNAVESVVITLSRFNSSLTRIDAFDQIIDLTISMESLIQSTVELKYKFALYHSFICGHSAEHRSQLFEQFKVLYDARSSIVHGDTATKAAKKKIDATVQQLPSLIEHAHKAIVYYIAFLYDNEHPKWQIHLDGMVLGTESRFAN